MNFRLVPKSVTLNDLERRNGTYFALFFTEFGSFRAHCVKVVDIAITMDNLRLLVSTSKRLQIDCAFTFAISSSDEFLYDYCSHIEYDLYSVLVACFYFK